MLRRKFLEGSALFGIAGALPVALNGESHSEDKVIFNVLSYGASGKGTHLDTSSIQAAVDACARAGGGIVLFPAGRYLTGTILLRSHVRLWLAEGSTLLGSPNLADYPPHKPAFQSTTAPYTDRYIIYGEKLENIGIEGRGTIDGQGKHFASTRTGRPYLIRFSECRNISVRGVTLKNSAMWAQHYLACKKVLVEGIRVTNHANVNNDGIDIDCSEDVQIANCDIDSGDDAIVLKSGGLRVTRNVAVSNCVIRSRCNALKTGTESNGGFENIAFNNCTIHDTGLAGLALETVDGGTLNGIVASNLVMKGIGTPLFIRLGNRARPLTSSAAGQPVGSVSNILIDNIFATGGGKVGCSVTGLPGHPIRNVSFSNLQLVFVGGGTRAEAQRTVPEKPKAYPEFNMFGVLPAYGLYCRHVAGLRFSNIETAFLSTEYRPALLCEDLNDLEVLTSNFAAIEDGSPSVVLQKAHNAMVQGCWAARQEAFLSLVGPDNRSVTLLANDLHLAARPVKMGPDVAGGTVFAAANHTSHPAGGGA